MRNFVKGLLLSTVIFGASAVMADFAIEEGQIYTSGAFVDSNGELWDIVDVKDIGGKTVFTVWNSQTGNESVTRVVSTARTMPETVRASVYKSTRGLADYYTKNVGPITTGTTVASTSPATTTTATTPKTTTSTMPRNSYPGIGDGTPQGRANYSAQDLYEIQRQSITGPQGTTTTSSASSSANAQTLGDSVASRVALAEGRINAAKGKNTPSSAAAGATNEVPQIKVVRKGTRDDLIPQSEINAALSSDNLVPIGNYSGGTGNAPAAYSATELELAALPTPKISAGDGAKIMAGGSQTSTNASTNSAAAAPSIPSRIASAAPDKGANFDPWKPSDPYGREYYPNAEAALAAKKTDVYGSAASPTTAGSSVSPATSSTSRSTTSNSSSAPQVVMTNGVPTVAVTKDDLVPQTRAIGSASNAPAASSGPQVVMINGVPTVAVTEDDLVPQTRAIAPASNAPAASNVVAGTNNPNVNVVGTAKIENGNAVVTNTATGASTITRPTVERRLTLNNGYQVDPSTGVVYDTNNKATGYVTKYNDGGIWSQDSLEYTDVMGPGSKTKVADLSSGYSWNPTSDWEDFAPELTTLKANFGNNKTLETNVNNAQKTFTSEARGVATPNTVGAATIKDGVAYRPDGAAIEPSSQTLPPSGDRFPAGNPNPLSQTDAPAIVNGVDPGTGVVYKDGKPVGVQTDVVTPSDPNAPETTLTDWGNSLNEKAKIAADRTGPTNLQENDFNANLADPKTRPIGAINPENPQQAWDGEKWTFYGDIPTAGPIKDSYVNVTNDNVGALGGKDLFGGGWFSNNSPRMGSDGNLVISDSAANILKNQYGLERAPDLGKNTLISDGTQLGNTRGTALLDLMNTQQNLATARTNYNNALNEYNKTDAAIQNIINKAPNGDFTKLSETDRSELNNLKSKQEMQGKALDAARNARDAAHDANLAAAHANLSAAENKFNNDMRGALDSGQISQDEWNNLNDLRLQGDQDGLKDAIKNLNNASDDLKNQLSADAADVNNAQGIVNKAGEAEANETDVEPNLQEAHEANPIEWVYQILAYKKANDKLSVEQDINIKAGEIGEPMQPVDSSALPTDDGSDGTRATTVLGAASMVKQLLSAATIDLNLLSEKVTFDTPEGPTTENLPGASVSGSGSSVGGGAETPESGADDDDDDGDEDDGDNAQKEAIRKEIERRRAELLKQYVSAGIQIAEGMNAISNDFPSRAGLLHSTLEPTNQGGNNNQTSGGKSLGSAVRTEPQAFGLMQDVGRYVLFETLRGVALSSVQMGVQASRLLFEQEVMDETSN